MLEEWRPVVGYEGSYEVSNLGRVRSLDRTETFERVIWQTGERCVVSRRHRGAILIPEKVKGSDYLRVSLGKGNKLYVHAIVLTAFAGPAPDGCECLHGDGDRANNSDLNLRWGTRLENVHDAIKHGTANFWGHRSHA
jgi:hypothetical protein